MKAFLFNQKMSFLLRSICFLFLVSSFLNTFVYATQHLCHPNERDVLLKFKNEFGIQKPDFGYIDVSNSYPKTRSWVSKTDCCSWDGITCDAKSGKVIGLDLSSSFLHGHLESNSSLFRLHHLRDLNLAYNNFTSSPIPAELDKLLELERLNLSESSFSGQIPTKILQLTKLVSLDLSSYSTYSLSIDESFLHLLAQNLSNLRELDMSYVNISSEIPYEFSNLRSLRLLNLVKCNLYGKFPSSVFLIPNLQFIALTSNPNLRGNLPVFRENNSLLYLRIHDTSFSGTIPNSITNLIHLSSLTLFNSKFYGKIPISLGNLSQLSHLSLYSNNFVGEIPSSIGNLKQLTYFDVGSNKLSGNLPASILNLTQLRYLSLSSNQFTSSFLSNISQLYKLETFVGSKNNFTNEIPRSICGLKSLMELDLSNNNLHGSISWCFETLMSSLTNINLSNNSLSGSLPEIFMNAKNLGSLDVSHNQMEGKLPASLTGCSALELLNVGSNRISDMFPFQLNSLKKLQLLILRSNKFHGTLHNADGVWFGFPQLKIIDVSHNDFSGTLPSNYFMNWTVMSSNRDNYMEPQYITSPKSGLYYYYTIVLMIKGVSMEMERILTTYTSIDFSGNQLHGQIPNSTGLLKELLILNLSSNSFTGHIPSSLANLTNLESLDLSQNKISGEIPAELGTLSSLAWINVSHNQLEGSIPQGTQFQRQNCSCYEGNPGIYGPSLKDVCGDKIALTQPQPKTLETKEEEEESLNWIAAGLGFAPGVVFGLSMGYIVTSYKHVWLMKICGRRKQQSTRAR